VSWLRSWYVHVAEEVRGSTPTPYMHMGSWCTILGYGMYNYPPWPGWVASTYEPILSPTHLNLIKKFGYTFLKLQNSPKKIVTQHFCWLIWPIKESTTRLVKKTTNQINRVKNDLTKITNWFFLLVQKMLKRPKAISTTTKRWISLLAKNIWPKSNGNQRISMAKFFGLHKTIEWWLK
jgi:hypothetical protein